MYPLNSYLILEALYQERVGRSEDALLAQQHHPVVRSLALRAGNALIALGNRLEHFGQ